MQEITIQCYNPIMFGGKSTRITGNRHPQSRWVGGFDCWTPCSHAVLKCEHFFLVRPTRTHIHAHKITAQHTAHIREKKIWSHQDWQISFYGTLKVNYHLVFSSLALPFAILLLSFIRFVASPFADCRRKSMAICGFSPCYGCGSTWFLSELLQVILTIIDGEQSVFK